MQPGEYARVMNLKRTAAALTLTFASSLSVAAPVQLSYRTFHFTCQQGPKVSVSYLNYGKSGPTFAVLKWNGNQYGLAQAISASGARYAALYGGPNNAGLEWWEHHSEATLSTFLNGDPNTTKALLTCKSPR